MSHTKKLAKTLKTATAEEMQAIKATLLGEIENTKNPMVRSSLYHRVMMIDARTKKGGQ